MSIEINNINPQRPDNNRSQGAKGTQEIARKEQPASENQGSSQAGNPDNVSLSQEAQTLARIEADLKTQPEVDQARVEEVRARIESGNYQIDNDKLAQKMLDLEG